MKTKMMTLLLALGSVATFAQHDHAIHSEDKKTYQTIAMFKDSKLGTAYRDYLHVKDALVSSKSDEARKGASELQNALKEIKGSAAALEAVSKIATSSDLVEQRKAFSTLSDDMAKLVKGSKLSAGSLYLEYCPMANNNEGAYWLSNEEEINNPYFGDMMLKCGRVEEIIK